MHLTYTRSDGAVPSKKWICTATIPDISTKPIYVPISATSRRNMTEVCLSILATSLDCTNANWFVYACIIYKFIVIAFVILPSASPFWLPSNELNSISQHHFWHNSLISTFYCSEITMILMDQERRNWVRSMMERIMKTMVFVWWRHLGHLRHRSIVFDGTVFRTSLDEFRLYSTLS